MKPDAIDRIFAEDEDDLVEDGIPYVQAEDGDLPSEDECLSGVAFDRATAYEVHVMFLKFIDADPRYCRHQHGPILLKKHVLTLLLRLIPSLINNAMP